MKAPNDRYVILQLYEIIFVFQMSSQVFGSKKFNATPPDKGSFPLDHDGECKKFYLEYMICLNSNRHQNTECRTESKNYLGCR